jgi:quercetin dioxygenase-like cupin family protein
MKVLAAVAMSLNLMDPALAETGHRERDRAAPSESPAAVEELQISRTGTRTLRAGPPANFTGEVRVEMLFQAPEPARVSGAYVTFTAGAHTDWHTHPLGQTLVVTEGVGRVQRWGGPIEEIRAGDVVWIPPGVKHWHGASPDRAMTHLAIQEVQGGRSADWFEKVTNAQYGNSPSATGTALDPRRP